MAGDVSYGRGCVLWQRMRPMTEDVYCFRVYNVHKYGI